MIFNSSEFVHHLIILTVLTTRQLIGFGIGVRSLRVVMQDSEIATGHSWLLVESRVKPKSKNMVSCSSSLPAQDTDLGCVWFQTAFIVSSYNVFKKGMRGTMHSLYSQECQPSSPFLLHFTIVSLAK